MDNGQRYGRHLRSVVAQELARPCFALEGGEGGKVFFSEKYRWPSDRPISGSHDGLADAAMRFD